MRVVIFTILVATLLSVQGCSEGAVTNRGLSKGGFGIINQNLYIVVKSAKNELLWGARERWTGKSAGTSEVVFYFDGKIWSSPDLPSGFDLSKSVAIFFEGDVIRFFEFGRGSGGYYQRMIPEK
ncbi:MAG: hypothetical protein ACLQKA_11640 [Bryobacteraceae bacterium]